MQKPPQWVSFGGVSFKLLRKFTNVFASFSFKQKQIEIFVFSCPFPSQDDASLLSVFVPFGADWILLNTPSLSIMHASRLDHTFDH